MRYPYIDMHCDTLFRGHQYNEASIYDGEGMQSIRHMCDAGQVAQFYAIFFPPKEDPDAMPGGCPPITSDQAYYDLLRSQLLHLAEKHPEEFAMAYSYQDLMTNHSKGLSSAFLTLEDGRLVNGSMEKLHELYNQGVRAIALTWNYANCFGAPNSRDPKIMQTGLTAFGRDAIEEMNRLGMIIDVSHLSDGGFYDVARLSRKPFIASHSNCRSLTNHPRNMTDDMIHTLGDCGGVAGINFYSAFTHPDPSSDESRIKDIVHHVLHMINYGGEDCIGIGTDFDGMDCKLEISHPHELDFLFEALKTAGLTERVLDKIARDNVLRVIKDTL